MIDLIKIITPPDIIFDNSYKILVINPYNDLKQSTEEWATNEDHAISIYYYNIHDSDVKWLLTMANICDVILIDVDNCNDHVNSFLSYLISLSTTYYRTSHNMQPWNLLNQNRFFDFPVLPKDLNER
jgi:hypothetical protein